LIVNADAIYQNYRQFQSSKGSLARDKNGGNQLRQLEERYNLRAESMIRIRNSFHNCFDQFSEITIDMHPTYDLALLRFKNYNQKLYPAHAVFARDSSFIKPGRSLCRLGYPFPEFTNFRYNAQTDDIEWTETGRLSSARFPIDGIVTRLIADPNGTISGIEMSTPGLRGQSGGPLFDTHGLIYGMQSATRHLHLGFDIQDMEVLVNNRKTKVSNYPFLNVGLCVHVDVIKAFLRERGVKFYEA